MQEIRETEIETLRAIFLDTFEQIDDNTIEFDFPSNHFNQDFKIQIKFSENYPQEPLDEIKIISGQISQIELKLLNQMLIKEQKQFLNENEGYIFQLINKIDDDEVVQRSKYQDEESDDENSDDSENQIQINHGQLAGIPLTKENFEEMQEEFIKIKNINLAEDKDFTNIDFTKPQSEQCTGYEYFKRKEFKGENVE